MRQISNQRPWYKDDRLEWTLLENRSYNLSMVVSFLSWNLKSFKYWVCRENVAPPHGGRVCLYVFDDGVIVEIELWSLVIGDEFCQL